MIKSYKDCSTITDPFSRLSNGCPSLTEFKTRNYTQYYDDKYDDKKDIDTFIALFRGKKDEPWKTEAPELLTFFANIIDMTYNYTSGEKWHSEHTQKNNLMAVRQNTPGFVATHMFVEYLMYAKRIHYREALKRIAFNLRLSPSDWYIGQAFANATWRQTAIFRDKCHTGDWKKSFNSIVEENNITLAKDTVQLKMCAYIILDYLKSINSGMQVQTTLPELKGKKEQEYVRETILDDFPQQYKKFVEHLKTIYQSFQSKDKSIPKRNGGSSKELRDKAKTRKIKECSRMMKNDLTEKKNTSKQSKKYRTK